MSRIIGKVYENTLAADAADAAAAAQECNLSAMTVAQLLEMAAEAGIAVPPNAKKSDIIAVIEDELHD